MNEKKRVKRQDDPGGGNWTDTTDDDNQPVLSLSLPLALCPFGYLPHPRAEMASTLLAFEGTARRVRWPRGELGRVKSGESSLSRSVIADRSYAIGSRSMTSPFLLGLSHFIIKPRSRPPTPADFPKTNPAGDSLHTSLSNQPTRPCSTPLDTSIYSHCWPLSSTSLPQDHPANLATPLRRAYRAFSSFPGIGQ